MMQFSSGVLTPSRLLSEVQPTPLEFDEFIPWMCLQYQCPEIVTVTRIYQEEYVKAKSRRASSKSVKSIKNKVPLTESQVVVPPESGVPTGEDNIQIKAYYNYYAQLQEVSIVGCPFDINRTVIQVFGLAVPYHPTLSKLTIIKGGLTATILLDIGRLLPKSYLTDICLDDTNVPQKNYTALLQHVSQLKNLSLNRCTLDDETCKDIAASLDIGNPGCTLRTLELSSNMLSDDTALAFADVLRRNRHLLHLNLSGNLITDKGAVAILNTFIEFPMRCDEIADMKRNRLEFNRKKIFIYDRYVNEIMAAKRRATAQARSASRSKSLRSGSSKSKSPVLKKNNNKKAQTADSVIASMDGTEKTTGIYSHPELELKAREAVGEFHDPFNAEHIVLKNKHFYCVGNMFLCSLNLAYNNLGYSSVQKINTVLGYQSEVKHPHGSTGLLRITFDGNYVPKYCEEYGYIDMLLKEAIRNQLPKAGTSKKKSPPQSAGPRKSKSHFGTKV